MEPPFHDSHRIKPRLVLANLAKTKTKFSTQHEFQNAKTWCSANRRRCVTFDPKATVHTILSREDYSLNEFVCCWYTSRDRQRMERERHFDIRCLEAGVIRKEESASFRGLEHLTIDGIYKQKRRRKILMDAIMCDQKCSSPANEAKLASISIRVSLVGKANALMNAGKDRREALQASLGLVDSKRRELLLDDMGGLQRLISELHRQVNSYDGYDDDGDIESDSEEIYWC